MNRLQFWINQHNPWAQRRTYTDEIDIIDAYCMTPSASVGQTVTHDEYMEWIAQYDNGLEEQLLARAWYPDEAM